MREICLALWFVCLGFSSCSFVLMLFPTDPMPTDLVLATISFPNSMQSISFFLSSRIRARQQKLRKNRMTRRKSCIKLKFSKIIIFRWQTQGMCCVATNKFPLYRREWEKHEIASRCARTCETITHRFVCAVVVAKNNGKHFHMQRKRDFYSYSRDAFGTANESCGLSFQMSQTFATKWMITFHALHLEMYSYDSDLLNDISCERKVTKMDFDAFATNIGNYHWICLEICEWIFTENDYNPWKYSADYVIRAKNCFVCLDNCWCPGETMYTAVLYNFICWSYF